MVFRLTASCVEMSKDRGSSVEPGLHFVIVGQTAILLGIGSHSDFSQTHLTKSPNTEPE